MFAQFPHRHEVSEPSVGVNLLIPAKTVSEAYGKLSEVLRPLVADMRSGGQHRAMVGHFHADSEPSVDITLLLPVKTVPEAWACLPESLRVHVIDMHQLTPPASYADALTAVGSMPLPPNLQELKDLQKRQTEATEELAQQGRKKYT